MRCSSVELTERWQGILAFSLDDPQSSLTFTRRLARENGWKLGYAVRVVDEYKRFMFLVLAAGHPVTPSEDVDQVWHLHMVYTRSYWREFCGEVLGREIHHGPARGTAGEQEHFGDQYERTKASYERLFGEIPPADIWPSAEQRFGDDLRWQRVNLRSHWVIAKPRCSRWFTRSTPRKPLAASPAVGKATLAAMLIPLTLGVVNPLEYNGPDFLQFFALMAVIAFVAAIVLRMVLLSLRRGEDYSPDDLEPLHLALLNDDGRQRFAQAGMAALVSSGAAAVEELNSESVTSSTGVALYKVDALSAQPSVSLDRLQRRLAALGTTTVEEAAKESLVVAEEEEEELYHRGLLTSNWILSPALWGPIAPLLLVLLLGSAKLSIGVSRGKPVGFLILGMVIVAIIMAVGFFRKPRRTQKGDHLLRQALDQHQLLAGDSVAGGTLRPESVALAVGLFGTAYLLGSELDLLHRTWPVMHQSSWTDGFTSGDGGCGGDSGGCGGGCGGGGCGGCGGD